MPTLYPYQVTGRDWLQGRKAGLLADAMGLGKTAQALAALPPGAPVVVVCPASVKGVWKAEAAAWRPEYAVTVLAGRGSFRWPAPGEIVCVNYDILPKAIKVGRSYTLEGVTAPPAGVVIVADEAHALKNYTAARTKAFRILSHAVRAAEGRVWLLTGTPLLNRPPELYSVLAAAGLDTVAFGRWPEFVSLFQGRKGGFGGWQWGTPDRSVPERLARVMLRRRREDVLPQLPQRTYQTITVNGLDSATKAICDDALRQLASEAGHDIQKAMERLKPGMPAFTAISAARVALAAAKVGPLVELLDTMDEEGGAPLVVFSAHRLPVDVVSKRPGWESITGDTSPEDRTRIVAEFQAGRLRGLSATIAAGGVGLTLTAAHRALFVDLAWTPALNDQAECRLLRIGQTRGVLVTRLDADHELDRRVNQILHEKQMLISRTVDAAAALQAIPIQEETAEEVDVFYDEPGQVELL